MPDIFSLILNVAKSLLDAAEFFRASSRQRREDMAVLFEEISACLTDVATEIRLGGVPHGRCAEMQQYARDLPDKTRKELGDDRAEELGGTLADAYNVEQVAMELQRVEDAADKEPYLATIEEAAGKFRALANLVKVR